MKDSMILLEHVTVNKTGTQERVSGSCVRLDHDWQCNSKNRRIHTLVLVFTAIYICHENKINLGLTAVFSLLSF
jgi:hypothetical protein